MIPAQAVIQKLRRDLTLGSLLRGMLLVAALACVFVEAIDASSAAGGSFALAAVGAVWMILSYRSIRGSQMAAASPALIAAGDLEQAEENIEAALGSFSLFRSAKLRSLHHLLLLRHAQRRYAEAAVLCSELLNHRLGSLSGLSRSTRLVLADSLLEVGDTYGAHRALAGLYHERLTLGEALELTLVQLEYEARVGAWGAMIQSVQRKTQLAELMTAEKGARAQALLALAARRTGATEWEAFLRRRAELLGDVNELVTRRPVLKELWVAA